MKTEREEKLETQLYGLLVMIQELKDLKAWEYTRGSGVDAQVRAAWSLLGYKIDRRGRPKI